MVARPDRRADAWMFRRRFPTVYRFSTVLAGAVIVENQGSGGTVAQRPFKTVKTVGKRLLGDVVVTTFQRRDIE
jgi:hypothetical protein